jgi:putative PEP-CTERM system TPR-repeat lipoprotein
VESAEAPASAWSLLGDLERARRDLEAAEQAYGEAIARSHSHPTELMRRAEARVALGRLDEAQDDVDALHKQAPRSWRSSYAQGLVEMARERAEEALPQFELVLKSNPAHVESLYGAGWATASLGRNEQAVDYLTRVLSRDQGNFRARRLLASLRLQAGDYEDVKEILGPALSAGSLDLVGATMYAQALLSTGQEKPAVRILEQVAKQDAKSAKAQSRLGVALLAIGEEEKARAAFARALDLDPSETLGREAIIRHLLDDERVDEALTIARDYAETRPESVSALNLLGLVRLERDEVEEARSAFQQARELEPGNPTASAMMALIALRAGEGEEAKRLFLEILDQDTDNVQALGALASLELREGDMARAEELLTRAIDLRPDSLATRISLAQLLLVTDRVPRALDLLEEVRKEHAEDPGFLLNYGLVQLAAGSLEAARRTAEQLVRITPDKAVAHTFLARVHSRLGDPERALDGLAAALADDPANAVVREIYIMLLAREGRISEAQQQLDALKETTPDSWTVDYLSALLATADNRPEAAKEQLRQGFERRATRQTMLALAIAEEQSGGLDESIAIQSQWLAANSGDLGIRLSLANTYLKSGRVPEALAEYEKVLEQDGENVLALNNLAWHLRESAPKEALGYAERAYAVSPGKATVADTLSAILIGMQRYEEAKRVLSRSLDADPNATVLKYRWARLLAETGSREDAVRRLEELLSSQGDFAEREQATELLTEIRGD